MIIKPCKIIGVLDDGPQSLGSVAIDHIKSADLIIGGHRTLDLFNGLFKPESNQIDFTKKLTQVSTWVADALAEKKSVVILATGDPLCHGIAQYLIKGLQKKLNQNINTSYCEIIPNVSSIQMACAKVALSWQDLKIASVHSKDAGEWKRYADPSHGLYQLLQNLKHHHKLAVLTSPENTPDRIARMMQQEGLENKFSSISVIENLLTKEENIIIDLSVETMAAQTFNSPNVLLLERVIDKSTPNENSVVLFGHQDSYYHQRKPDKGLITKREVRAVSLARMQLTVKSIVWDIGAGSGSIGLEAATLCPQGHVYAIEKNEADLNIIENNRKQMKLTNYSLFHGRAPEHLDKWPAPSAIFIGGSGGELSSLIKIGLARLTRGWLIMNFVTIENLSTAIETLKALNAEQEDDNKKIKWDICQLQVSRSQPILHMNRFAAENPVWVVSAKSSEI